MKWTFNQTNLLLDAAYPYKTETGLKSNTLLNQNLAKILNDSGLFTEVTEVNQTQVKNKMAELRRIYIAHKKAYDLWGRDQFNGIASVSEEVFKVAVAHDPSLKKAKGPFVFFDKCDLLWAVTDITGQAAICSPVQSLPRTVPGPSHFTTNDTAQLTLPIIGSLDPAQHSIADQGSCSEIENVNNADRSLQTPRQLQTGISRNSVTIKKKGEGVNVLDSTKEIKLDVMVHLLEAKSSMLHPTKSHSRQVLDWATSCLAVTRAQSTALGVYLIEKPHVADLILGFTDIEDRLDFLASVIPAFQPQSVL